MPTKSKTKAGNFKAILAKSGQAPALPAADPATARRMKAGYIQVGANIPKTLKREVFKQLQDEDGLNFSTLVEQLLSDWLTRRK